MLAITLCWLILLQQKMNQLEESATTLCRYAPFTFYHCCVSQLMISFIRNDFSSCQLVEDFRKLQLQQFCFPSCYDQRFLILFRAFGVLIFVDCDSWLSSKPGGMVGVGFSEFLWASFVRSSWFRGDYGLFSDGLLLDHLLYFPSTFLFTNYQESSKPSRGCRQMYT